MPDDGRWVPAYVGLGANIGDCLATLKGACDAIGRIAATRLVCCSSIYRSAPMGPTPQPDFYNAVVALLTRLEPGKLLAAMLAIEREFGRERSATRWGPRTLDLDLLLFGNRRMSETGLTIPHPGLAERNFVLYPLAEIAPQLPVPGVGTAEKLAAVVGNSGLQKLELES